MLKSENEEPLLVQAATAGHHAAQRWDSGEAEGAGAVVYLQSLLYHVFFGLRR